MELPEISKTLSEINKKLDELSGKFDEIVLKQMCIEEHIKTLPNKEGITDTVNHQFIAKSIIENNPQGFTPETKPPKRSTNNTAKKKAIAKRNAEKAVTPKS